MWHDREHSSRAGLATQAACRAHEARVEAELELLAPMPPPPRLFSGEALPPVYAPSPHMERALAARAREHECSIAELKKAENEA